MNAPDSIRPLLSRHYLFSALNDAQLDAMLRSMQFVEIAEGGTLFHHGDPAERFFMQLDGQTKLYRLSEDGDEKVVEIIKPGQLFAEAVMFMEAKRYPVNATALAPSLLAGFSNSVFINLLSESHDACFRLMASMSQRLHRQINEIDALTLHNATYRLVSYLLMELPEGAGAGAEVALNTPKHVIASRLSIQPETFSRILARLTKDGLIEVQGANIVLRDQQRLHALVSL